jgi:phthiodiolone/phenolphthiodiolone dimycocerosates ketoreductase
MRPLTFGIPGDIMPPAERMLERVRRNEADGWEAIWWPDHLMGWHASSVWTEDITPLAAVQPSPHVWFDPVPVIGAAATVTSRIRFGTCVTDPIRRPPPVLALAFLTLDHLSRGRTIMGVGSGESLNLEPYGLPADRMVSRFDESIQAVRLLIESAEPVTFEGDFVRIRDGLIGLRPYTPGGPPIWIAAHRPRMLRITGRYGDGWLPTKMDPSDYRGRLEVVRDAAEAAGRDREHVVAGMLSYVLCAETESQLEELVRKPLIRGLCLLLPAEVFEKFGYEPPFGAGSYGFRDFVPTRYPRSEALAAMAKVPPEVVLYYCLAGTPDMIRDQVMDLRAAGLEHLILWNVTAFAEPRLAAYSFEVLREIRRQLTEPAPAG